MAASEQLPLGLPIEPPQDSVDTDGLPDGWRLVTFGEVCEINPSRKGRTNYPDDLPVTFVSMSAVDEVDGMIAAPEVKPFSAVKKGYTWFVENDVLFAKITPCMQNGKAAIARNLSNGVGFGSTEFHVLRPGPNVLPEWIHLFIRQPSFRVAAAQHFTGSVGQQRVPESFLIGQLLPLPPISDQGRIAARAEEMVSKGEQVRELQQQVKKTLPIAIATALSTMRERLLRQGYPQQAIGHLTQVTAGGTPSRSVAEYWNGNIPWVKTGELIDGDIDSTEEQISESGLANSSAKIFPPGTVLIALYGQGQTRGRTGHLRIQAATNQACCAILPVPSILNPRYVQYWLRSFYSTLREQARGASQDNLNSGMIKAIEIAVAPLTIQQQVVEYLDSIQVKVEEVSRMRAESSSILDELQSSLLEQAFIGEL